MREAPELLTLFWLECIRFGDCNVYFSAIKLLSYTNHNCNCMIDMCSSSKVVAVKSVICHPLLKIAQLKSQLEKQPAGKLSVDTM